MGEVIIDDPRLLAAMEWEKKKEKALETAKIYAFLLEKSREPLSEEEAIRAYKVMADEIESYNRRRTDQKEKGEALTDAGYTTYHWVIGGKTMGWKLMEKINGDLMLLPQICQPKNKYPPMTFTEIREFAAKLK